MNEPVMLLEEVPALPKPALSAVARDDDEHANIGSPVRVVSRR